MAKKVVKEKKESFTRITTPSPFGSNKTMLVEPPEGVILKEGECVCKDDKGLYITFKNRLDNGLADPKRYSSSKARL